MFMFYHSSQNLPTQKKARRDDASKNSVALSGTLSLAPSECPPHVAEIVTTCMERRRYSSECHLDRLVRLRRAVCAQVINQHKKVNIYQLIFYYILANVFKWAGIS